MAETEHYHLGPLTADEVRVLSDATLVSFATVMTEVDTEHRAVHAILAGMKLTLLRHHAQHHPRTMAAVAEKMQRLVQQLPEEPDRAH
jgi:predicted transcriptional regulator